MRGLLAGLTPAARGAVLGVLGVVAVLAAVGGVWAFLQQRETSARQAFAAAASAYQAAMAEGSEGSQLAEAARTLKQFVNDYPRSASATSAWYFLGNVEYRKGGHDAAIAAFDEAAKRSSTSIGVLSWLGSGYAWEAKQDPGKALVSYEQGLKGRGPKDFQYAELLLGVARAQEQLKQPAAAIATYRRLLKEAPEAPGAAEARGRLAILGAPAA